MDIRNLGIELERDIHGRVTLTLSNLPHEWRAQPSSNTENRVHIEFAEPHEHDLPSGSSSRVDKIFDGMGMLISAENGVRRGRLEVLRPTVTLTIPGTPPSVNRYKRQRAGGKGYFLTAEVRKFQEDVAWLAAIEKRKLPSGDFFRCLPAPYGIDVRVFFAAAQRTDSDNVLKVLLDSLTKAAVITDDREVYELQILKYRGVAAAEARTEIEIRSLGNYPIPPKEKRKC